MIAASVGGVDLEFETEPQLFSPRWFDEGSLAMLEQVVFSPEDKVLDLGCGYGLVGVVAAKAIPPERVWLIDNDPAAVACARRNLARNGVGGAHCEVSDGFRRFDETGFSKILSNPPYHADFAVPKHFIEKGFNRLAIGGAMWMVTRREGWYREKLSRIFGGVRLTERGGYFVFEAQKRAASYADRRR